MTGLAGILTGRVMNEFSDSSAADIRRADELITRTLAIPPNNTRAHHEKGQILRWQRRIEEAIVEYERVIADDRNWAGAYARLGWCKFQSSGSASEAIPLVERGIQLSPRDPGVPNWSMFIGFMLLLTSSTDEALMWLEKARSGNARRAGILRPLAAAYALKGDSRGASDILREALRLGDTDAMSLARVRTRGIFAFPKIRALAEGTYFLGLRLAGMPEE